MVTKRSISIAFAFIVGLQYHVELDESTIRFCVVPSAGLLSLALDIGISPTYYVTLDRPQARNVEQDV